MKQFKWQKQIVSLKQGVNEVYFNDTRPNVFFVINPNNTYLYFSLYAIPSATSYDYRMRPNGTDAFGRPLPSSRLYVYNPKNEEISIEVYSDEQSFDMGILKALNLDLDDETISKLKFDGIVRGWDTTDIVKTQVDNFQDLLDKLDEAIGTHFTILSGKESLSYGTDITVQAKVKEIVSVTNDTNSDITITCSGAGQDVSFWLRPGEALEGVKYLSHTMFTISTDKQDCDGDIRYILAAERGA